MKIEAWWFNNTQKKKEILQPDWFTPKTHLGIYIEPQKIQFPIALNVIAYQNGLVTYTEKTEICDENYCEKYKTYENRQSPKTCEDCEKYEKKKHYDVFIKNDRILIKLFPRRLCPLPDKLHIQLKIKNKTHKKDVKCLYSVIKGRTTDFDFNPFPAPVVFERKFFGGKTPYIGVWSDKDGYYSVTVPNGEYDAFYVDDNTYKVSTLENWSWKMTVDGNENHHFKIGTGEVYGLSVSEHTGGGNILFVYFRPMVLPEIRYEKYQISLNGKKREVTDVQPDLRPENLKILIDGRKVNIFSLQKIYETGKVNGEDFTLVSYVAQTERPLLEKGKHTLILEYRKVKKYKSESQGRTQFFIR